MRTALGGVLRDEGYNVDAVDSGEACLERVVTHAYDVVLLDVWMPGIDGLETLQRLRERRVDAQVVVISGHGNVESAVRAIKLGRLRLRREAAVARQGGAGRAQRAAPAARSKPRTATCARRSIAATC